uniref:Uncharacterized protein n=1 Tax=Arundo donax TaxID=35708 RepID=A0A0A9BX43_ARUDO
MALTRSQNTIRKM